MDMKDDINEVENPTGKYLTPFQRKLLQKSLQENLHNSYRQRIQIMLLADEGKYQTEICRILGCCPATVRHWTHIARAGMAHQWQECPIGRHKTISDRYLERLQELVSHSPRDYGYCFGHWTANWLCKHLAKELGIEVSDRHLTRLLKQMGLSTRPKKTQNEESAASKNQSSKISIQDLKIIDPPENHEPLSLNLTNLDTDSYGAKSIRSVSVAATSPEDFGLSFFRSRSSTLSQTS